MATHETVYINVADANNERDAVKFLGTSHPNLRFCPIATDSCWCRDYSPSYVCRRDAEWRTPPLVAVDWGFVPLGSDSAELAKAHDDVFPMAAARVLEIPCISGGMALHGGDIEANGMGVMFTTEGCLLGRNPNFKKQWVTDRLKAMLGATNVHWLVDRAVESASPIASKSVDVLARFVADGIVVASAATETLDPSEEALRQNLRRLAADSSDGMKFEVVALPPVPTKGVLPASYTDFYIANEVVLMPAFDLRTDSKVRERFAGLFAGRQILEVKCDPSIGGGWIHRMIRQVPSFDLAQK